MSTITTTTSTTTITTAATKPNKNTKNKKTKKKKTGLQYKQDMCQMRNNLNDELRENHFTAFSWGWGADAKNSYNIYKNG